MTTLTGPGERGESIVLCRIHVSAAADQQPYHFELALLACAVDGVEPALLADSMSAPSASRTRATSTLPSEQALHSLSMGLAISIAWSCVELAILRRVCKISGGQLEIPCKRHDHCSLSCVICESGMVRSVRQRERYTKLENRLRCHTAQKVLFLCNGKGTFLQRAGVYLKGHPSQQQRRWSRCNTSPPTEPTPISQMSG